MSLAHPAAVDDAKDSGCGYLVPDPAPAIDIEDYGCLCSTPLLLIIQRTPVVNCLACSMCRLLETFPALSAPRCR